MTIKEFNELKVGDVIIIRTPTGDKERVFDGDFIKKQDPRKGVVVGEGVFGSDGVKFSNYAIPHDLKAGIFYGMSCYPLRFVRIKKT